MEHRREMNAADYLKRSARPTAITPNIETLSRLQRADLLAKPFENLDIHWRRPIVLDTERFYSKIVGERRGGFCYELNGLFNELLRSLGFETCLISARVSARTKLLARNSITPRSSQRLMPKNF